jgi:hypothetical protein
MQRREIPLCHPFRGELPCGIVGLPFAVPPGGTLTMTPEETQRTMDFILASQANSVVRMDRLEEDLKMLTHLAHDLLKVSSNLVGRTKVLESRSDSVDETLKVLRELLEASLRKPDSPKQDNN